MIQSLNEIKQVSGRDLDGQVDENTLIAGETSAGVFGVFKFLSAVANTVKNFFIGIAKTTVAGTTKIAVVKDDGTIEYISADDVLAYKNAKEETITGKKNFTNGIESKSVNTTNLDAESVNASNITASGALKGKTAEVDSLTVSNSADLPNYYKKSETYSKSDVYTKTETYSKSEVDNKIHKQISVTGTRILGGNGGTHLLLMTLNEARSILGLSASENPTIIANAMNGHYEANNALILATYLRQTDNTFILKLDDPIGVGGNIRVNYSITCSL